MGMSRTRWILLILSGVMALSSCAGAPAEVAMARPFDVVRLIDRGEPGTATPIDAVRVIPDGTVQALVESGHCVAPNRLEADETSGAVILSAYVIATSDGPCTQQIVPVFVALHLTGPVDDRAFKDGASQQSLRVVDCRSHPHHPLCKA